jgi:hypothetical protein
MPYLPLLVPAYLYCLFLNKLSAFYGYSPF